MKNKLELFISEINRELKSAKNKFSDFNSYHEGYAVILEELDELWNEIKKKNPDKKNLKSECKQVAAMAFRFYIDLLSEDT